VIFRICGMSHGHSASAKLLVRLCYLQYSLYRCTCLYCYFIEPVNDDAVNDEQRMPLAGGSSVGGVNKLPMPADARHISAAGPANQPPWTQGKLLLCDSISRNCYSVSLLFFHCFDLNTCYVTKV